MQSATPPEKETPFASGAARKPWAVSIRSRSGVRSRRPMSSSKNSAMRSVSRVRSSTEAARPTAMGRPMESTSVAIPGATYWTTRVRGSSFTRRPPMSRQVVSTTSPSRKRTTFVVPPPMSKLATAMCSRLEKLPAPAPLPARMDSRSEPAVATTKLPARPLRLRSTVSAFSLRAVSPVMMTAPAEIAFRSTPARAYSRSTILRTPSASMVVGERSGVKWMSLR